MSLTLEIPAEVENALREIATNEGHDLADFIIESVRERARLQATKRREEAQRIAKSDAALDELTRITEELGLYEENNFSPSQETELARRLEAYRNDSDTGHSWAQVRANT